jgi:hypothetical protein
MRVLGAALRMAMMAASDGGFRRGMAIIGRES